MIRTIYSSSDEAGLVQSAGPQKTSTGAAGFSGVQAPYSFRPTMQVTKGSVTIYRADGTQQEYAPLQQDSPQQR